MALKDEEIVMSRFELSDEQWERVEVLLPGRPGSSGRRGQDNRLFLDAVLWMARTGRRGVIFLSVLVRGTASSNGLIAGRRRVCGRQFSRLCKTPIWSG